MTFTISRQLLLDAGYTMWSENKFQKRIVDIDKRTRYFININEMPSWNLSETESNFWPTAQFSVKIPNGTIHSIEISLIQWFNDGGKYSGISILEMESEIDRYFTLLGGIYYDSE